MSAAGLLYLGRKFLGAGVISDNPLQFLGLVDPCRNRPHAHQARWPPGRILLSALDAAQPKSVRAPVRWTWQRTPESAIHTFPPLIHS